MTNFGQAVAALAVVVTAALSIPKAHAANIITFGVAPTGTAPSVCSGAVICSSNGTTGYFINGTGQAFDLSTINSWFQIDPDGMNHLATQTIPEPDGGAGGFLVTNDTGSAVTSFPLTLTDTFTASTPSVTTCGSGPQAGKECDNFTIHGNNATFGSSFGPTVTKLSGPNWNDCTQGTTVGQTCQGAAGGAAGDFGPNQVTYTWSGMSIAPNADFLITFASWNNSTFASPTAVPEPGSLALMGCALAGLGLIRRRQPKPPIESVPATR